MDRQAKSDCQLLVSEDWDSDLNYPLEHLKLEHFGVSDYEPGTSNKGRR